MKMKYPSGIELESAAFQITKETVEHIEAEMGKKNVLPFTNEQRMIIQSQLFAAVGCAFLSLKETNSSLENADKMPSFPPLP